MPSASDADPQFVPTLSAIQMVGPHLGWAVGAYAIFSTADGTHWSKQYASTEQFVGLDFISATTGWAVGVRTLLGTTDGGQNWEQLGEPSIPIRSVHFINTSTGWGIAGGTNPVEDHGMLLPDVGASLMMSTDGGATWNPIDSPANPQSLCFSDAAHGWLASGDGAIYASRDAGNSWIQSLATLQAGTSDAHQTVPQCGSPSASWIETTIPNAAAGHEPYVVYATQDGSHWRTVMSEPYTTALLLPGVPPGPDSRPGSFSMVDPMDAVFVGDGPASMISQSVVASSGGAVLRRTGSIANSSETFGAAFVSVTTGWVLTRIIDGDYVIESTTDGGFHWSQQLAVTPSSAG